MRGVTLFTLAALSAGSMAALMPRSSHVPGTCYVCPAISGNPPKTTLTGYNGNLDCTYTINGSALTCEFDAATGALEPGSTTTCSSAATKVNYVCPTSYTQNGIAYSLARSYSSGGYIYCFFTFTSASGTPTTAACRYDQTSGVQSGTSANCPAGGSASCASLGRRFKEENNFTAFRRKLAYSPAAPVARSLAMGTRASLGKVKRGAVH